VRIPPTSSAAVCVATRCSQMWEQGISLCLLSNNTYSLALGGPLLGRGQFDFVYSAGRVPIKTATAFRKLALKTVGGLASGWIDHVPLFADVPIRGLDSGFAAIGASDWVQMEVDNVEISEAGPRWLLPTSPECPKAEVGTLVQANPCETNGLVQPHQAFKLQADWAIRHVESDLCVAGPNATEGGRLHLERCDPGAKHQQFKHDYTLIRNAVQEMRLKDTGGLLLAGAITGPAIGEVFLSRLKPSSATGFDAFWNQWSFFPNTQQLRNQYVADARLGYPLCLSTCTTIRQQTYDTIHI